MRIGNKTKRSATVGGCWSGKQIRRVVNFKGKVEKIGSIREETLKDILAEMRVVRGDGRKEIYFLREIVFILNDH